VLIDSTALNREEVFQRVIELLHQRHLI